MPEAEQSRSDEEVHINFFQICFFSKFQQKISALTTYEVERGGMLLRGVYITSQEVERGGMLLRGVYITSQELERGGMLLRGVYITSQVNG